MPKGARKSEDEVMIGGRVYKLGEELHPGAREILSSSPPSVPIETLNGKLIQIVVEEEAGAAPLFPLAEVTLHALNADKRPLFLARLEEPLPESVEREYEGYSSQLRQITFQSVVPGWEPQLLADTSEESFEGMMAELLIPTVFVGVLPERHVSSRELESYQDLEDMVRVRPELLKRYGLVRLGFGVFQVFEEGVGFRREWPESRWKESLRLREKKLLRKAE